MREINIDSFSKTEMLHISYCGLVEHHVWNSKKQALELLENTPLLQFIEAGEEVSLVYDSNIVSDTILTGHFFNPILDEIVERYGVKAIDLFDDSYFYRDLIEKYKKKRSKIIKKDKWLPVQRVVIPDIGYQLRLVEDWDFLIKSEYRNHLWIFLDQHGNMSKRDPNALVWSDLTHPVTIRKGAELSVDRVYVRKGSSGWSSVTFYLSKGSIVSDGVCDYETNKKIRFFASLKEVNTVVAEWNEASFN